MPLQADITLLADDNFRVNAKHVALLEAVGHSGSIAAAARYMNLSYKAAWDALNSMQHLVKQPLLHKNTGGRGGGGAKLAPAGFKLIETWHQLQSGLGDLLKQAEAELYGCDDITQGKELEHFPKSVKRFLDKKCGKNKELEQISDSIESHSALFSVMRTSARNIFIGQVAEIIPLSQQQSAKNALLSDVCLDLGDNLFIHSSITSKSVARLRLTYQRPVHALVKASFVEIVPLEHFPKNENQFLDKNQLCGTICDFLSDDKNTEITVALGHAKTITATCLKEHALQAGLRHGLEVTAQFSPADVILATA